MTRPTQRQLLDVMKRAVERAGKASDERYGLKSGKPPTKAKPKRMTRTAPKRTRPVAAE